MAANTKSRKMEYEAEEIVDILESIPCRKHQIKFLLTLFGEAQQSTHPGLFIYGHTATGKSLVLNTVLNTLQTRGRKEINVDKAKSPSGKMLKQEIGLEDLTTENVINATLWQDASLHYITEGMILKIHDSKISKSDFDNQLEINVNYSDNVVTPHIVINCVEHNTARRLFEHILNHLSGTVPTPDNDFEIYSKCDNMNDFIRLLKGVAEERNIDQTIYLVFDKAERLRDMSINLLPGFLRLSELSGLNICCLLVTDIVWDKFRTGTGCLEPYIVHFSDYTKDELLELMTLDCPDDYKPHFYRNYCNLVLSIFHLVCRDLSELRHLALLNFPKYVEPVTRGEATVDQQSKLWRAIEPQLKKALQTVYLREVSSAQWERLQQQETEAAAASATTPASTSAASVTPSVTSLRTKVELPFYSKYLLIAAYLASYNPAKTDRRFFAKYKAGVGKRSQLASLKKHERTSNQLLGPKPFPLDRLMAIFYSIVESRIAPTANIFSQITTLVTLGLMTQVGSSDVLEAPKFKCLVALDFVKPIARTVDFDITRYLFDFV